MNNIKKSIAIVTLALFSATSASLIAPAGALAFHMSQPSRLGYISNTGKWYGGHRVEGADSVKANKYWHPQAQTYIGYDSGYATFDNGNLYVHFFGGKNSNYNYGGTNLANTFNGSGSLISKINTDERISIYVLQPGEIGTAPMIIAKRTDGKFVKYADCLKLYHDYVSSDPYNVTTGTVSSVNGDEIIIEYYGPQNRPAIKLKWNETAQWFSVTRIR